MFPNYFVVIIAGGFVLLLAALFVGGLVYAAVFGVARMVDAWQPRPQSSPSSIPRAIAHYHHGESR